MGHKVADMIKIKMIEKKIAGLFLVLTLLSLCCGCNNAVSHASSANLIQNVQNRVSLESEARKLAKEGYYDEAIVLYEKAIEPQNINYEHEKSTATGAIAEIHKWKGEYEKSLKYANWFLRNKPDFEPALIEKKEIEALIQYKNTAKEDAVVDHINLLKLKNSKRLPPNGYTSSSTIVISDIVRLYDTIGDYDAGMKFVNEILDYAFKTDKSNINFLKTSKECSEVISELESKNDGAKAYAYKMLREYLLVREAFEQDKKEGKKGSMKEGKPGRATLALIRSDYFPW